MITKHQRINKSSCPKIKSIAEKRFQRPFVILKTCIIHFPPKTSQKAKKHHLPHSSTPSTTINPPTNEQVNYMARHNPRQSKATKKDTPQGTINLTMEKEMVQGLSIPLTHTTPINHNDMLFPKIFHDKDLL